MKEVELIGRKPACARPVGRVMQSRAVAYLRGAPGFLNEIYVVEGASMDTTVCPECGALAEVLWRDVLESTAGPVEHAKIGCMNRHWFLLPLWKLEQPKSPKLRRHNKPALLPDSRRAP